MLCCWEVKQPRTEEAHKLCGSQSLQVLQSWKGKESHRTARNHMELPKKIFDSQHGEKKKQMEIGGLISKSNIHLVLSVCFSVSVSLSLSLCLSLSLFCSLSLSLSESLSLSLSLSHSLSLSLSLSHTHTHTHSYFMHTHTHACAHAYTQTLM